MTIYHIALVILLFAISIACSCRNDSGPTAAAPAVSRSDEFRYSFGSFYSASGSQDVSMVAVNAGPTAPIAWFKDQPIDIYNDTKSSVIERCGPNFKDEYESISYRNRNVFGSTIRIYPKQDIIAKITVGEAGGISTGHQTEVLRFPFSRKDLLRVFGEPDKTILSP